MNNPLNFSPSKGNQGTTRGKEKNLLTSVRIEPTTSGLDLRDDSYILYNPYMHEKAVRSTVRQIYNI